MPEKKWQVGDPVYVATNKSGGESFVPGVIESFTPTGRINVKMQDNRLQFDSRGLRRAGSSWDSYSQCIDVIPFIVRREWVIQRNQCRAAQDAIVAIGKAITLRESNFRRADMDEIKKQIAVLHPLFHAASVAVDAIGHPVDLKAHQQEGLGL